MEYVVTTGFGQRGGGEGRGQLSRNAAMVLKGFVELSRSDQDKVLAFMKDYRTKEQSADRADFRRKFARVDIGPVSGTRCPCCGK